MSLQGMHTCEVERSVATDHTEASVGVGRIAVVQTDVRRRSRRGPTRLARRQDSEEEQLSAGQQHPVDGRVLVGCDDRLTVTVPGDARRRLSFGLAVQRRRLVPHHVLVLGVLDYERVRYLAHFCTHAMHT